MDFHNDITSFAWFSSCNWWRYTIIIAGCNRLPSSAGTSPDGHCAKYLLAPEVSALLHYVPDLHRKMLLATPWNTGARINEALTRGDFSLAPPYPFVQLATLKILLERRNKRTGRTEKARIWEVTDRTVRTWLNEAVENVAADGVSFSVPVTPHTFRHSYAMHMLYAGIPLKVLQSLMGHKSVSSTEMYTKVFALNVAARHRVQFLMPGDDAVAMLRGNT